MGEGTVYANTGVMFCKIKQKDFRNNCAKAYWTKKVFDMNMGECYQNFSGGRLPCYLADVIETAICENETDFITWKRKEIYSYLIDTKSKYGWLSPSGEFYGCKYTHHQEVAELYFGKQEQELEKEHWIKVFKEYDSDSPVYASIHPNMNQLEWLEKNGVHYSKYACYQ